MCYFETEWQSVKSLYNDAPCLLVIVDAWENISLRTDKTGRNSCSTLQIRPCQLTLSVSLSLSFSHFLKVSLAPRSFCASRRVELLLATPPGHLEGLQMCSFSAVDRSISGDFPCVQLLFTSFTISPHFRPLHPPTLYVWFVALIENADCNQINWIKMSGLKMGDMRLNSHGSAWEMERLVEIMVMWVWSGCELLMVCFGSQFGCPPSTPTSPFPMPPHHTHSLTAEMIFLWNTSLK